MSPQKVVTMILSLVALIVTVFGFFAWLKFYRDGVSMQNTANKTMAAIEERVALIRDQFGGLVDRSFEALINRDSAGSEKIKEELEQAKESLVAEISSEISKTGKAEQSKLRKIVDEELKKVDDTIDTNVLTLPWQKSSSRIC